MVFCYHLVFIGSQNPSHVDLQHDKISPLSAVGDTGSRSALSTAMGNEEASVRRGKYRRM